MNSNPPSPSLGWQLGLILLPVALLAGFGVWSIRRDRQQIESEARERAARLAEIYGERLNRGWEKALQDGESTSRRWLADGGTNRFGVSWQAPGTGVPQAEWLGWRNGVPTDPLGKPEDCFPVTLRWDANGRLIEPMARPAVPVPPAWFRSQPPLAFRMWESWRTNTGGPSPAAVEAWLQAGGPEAGLWAAKARSWPGAGPGNGEDPAQAVATALPIVREALAARAETESGLPVATVVWAQALAQFPDAPLDGAGFALLTGLTQHQPSWLTPALLETLERQSRRLGRTAVVEALVALRVRWIAEEQARDWAARAQEVAGFLTPLGQSPPRTVWLHHRGVDWWMERSSTPPKPGEPEGIQVRRFPRPWLSATAGRLLRNRAGEPGDVAEPPDDLPPGLAVSVTLNGRRLGGWSADRAWPVGPSSEPQVLATRVSANPGWQATDVPLAYAVQIHLTDPDRLFAGQRRRQVWLGAVLLATAGVAGLGAWQARRAFHRQLALNAEQANFVASVSHELRAPLASVRLLAERLAHGAVTDPAKQREYGGYLLREARRLGTLVENVLDFARIEEGRKRYERVPTDLTRLVRETVDLPAALAGERGVTLVARVPEGPPVEACVDGTALQQALLNLLDNALKHGPAGSVVEISLGVASDRVRLSVQDSGPGLPAAEHERIFERFYRRGSELRRETTGVGLGLAIVRQIATAHGGRVWVESEPGQGATFHLELPMSGPGIPAGEREVA